MIEISVHRAVDNPNACSEYLSGHAQVLLDFGINVLTSFSESWFDNPDVFIITARDQENKLVGGIKIHRYNVNYPLPVVKGLIDAAPEIQNIIESKEPQLSGEICGLWISKNSGRKGLANYLSRAAIALCPNLSINHIYGISSPFTLNMFIGMGYTIIKEVGDSGFFDYPTPEFKSAVVEIINTEDLLSANSENKNKIEEIRNRLKFTSDELHNDIFTRIKYNLSI
jgi:hypothetical protein